MCFGLAVNPRVELLKLSSVFVELEGRKAAIARLLCEETANGKVTLNWRSGRPVEVPPAARLATL
jgi:hypothetical protein